MWAIGLTGSIATGKSTVLEAFKSHGAPVFSADAAVHELYAKGGGAVAQLEAVFSGISVDGAIDRQKLGAAVLGSADKLAALEAIVHPLVRDRITAFLTDSKETGAALAVVEVPLLLEGEKLGHDYGFDAIAVTHCDEKIQRDRALARPGMTEEKLSAILSRQMPQLEKRASADYAFDTGVSLRYTHEMVGALVEAIRVQAEIS